MWWVPPVLGPAHETRLVDGILERAWLQMCASCPSEPKHSTARLTVALGGIDSQGGQRLS